MANFTDILNRKSSEIERPKPLPPGTYLCLVAGQPRFDKSKQKQTDFVEFQLQILQAMEDVDQQALTEVGGAQGKTLRATYYLTEDAVFRLSNANGDGFLDQLGLTGDESLGEKIARAPGNQILASVRHRASQDGTQLFAEIANTAKV